MSRRHLFAHGLRPSGAALIAAALGTIMPTLAAERSEFTDLARSRYVHCAFYKTYDKDPVTGGPIMVEGKAHTIMHVEGIDLRNETARAIYTRMTGLRPVIVRQTDKALHFIDYVAGMYVMTTSTHAWTTTRAAACASRTARSTRACSTRPC
jgi:hypothetical protein